ncbi:MAG: hypothetical protein LC754_05865 [Acidobacteria bacterium]|nr:hypothetical protein [Acidobacteriota bacterium]
MVAKKRSTGSQKLSAKRGSKKAGTGALEKAVAAIDRRKLNHDILIRGIPIPNVIRGSVTVKPSQINTALAPLLAIKGIELKPVRLFPIGVPIIDAIRMQIDGKLRNK